MFQAYPFFVIEQQVLYDKQAQHEYFSIESCLVGVMSKFEIGCGCIVTRSD